MPDLDEFDSSAPPPAALMEPRQFKWSDKTLAPYSFARRLMWRSLFSEKDIPPDQAYSPALIFILSLTEEEARAYFHDMPALRSAFWEWMKGLSTDDYPEMVDRADEILKEAKRGEVRAAPGETDPTKKKV